MNNYYTQRIQHARERRSLTQKELSELLNIKQQQYARYEKGINIMPITYLPKICRVLNVSSDYIIGLTNEMAECPKK